MFRLQTADLQSTVPVKKRSVGQVTFLLHERQKQ